MESNAENSICEAESARITELFLFGMQNIWMKVIEFDKYYVTYII
jgi:hypothetical protein